MKIFLLTLALLSLAGCHDPKSANSRNFEQALERYLSQKRNCIVLTGISWPYVFKDHPLFEDAKKKLDALTAAGLISEEPAQVEVPSQAHAGPASRPRRVPAQRYRVTELGGKYKKEAKGFLGAYTAFCYARPSVARVVSFSEPESLTGTKVSRVSYEQKAVDFAPWARAEAIQERFSEVKEDIGGLLRTEEAALVLTDKGWLEATDLEGQAF